MALMSNSSYIGKYGICLRWVKYTFLFALFFAPVFSGSIVVIKLKFSESYVIYNESFFMVTFVFYV